MKSRKIINDLGVASFLKMNGFCVSGKKSRNFYFDIDEKDSEEFDALCVKFLNSAFHDFDSHLMSLKKLPEFLPEKPTD